MSVQFLSSLSYSFQFAFTSLVKFITRYFLDAIVNEIVFFISLSDGTLLVYRKTTDFF